MKKLLLAIFLAAIPATALAVTKLPLSYRQVYCYPTGTYWQKQINSFPDYYADHDAYYTAHYGAATKYCPAT